MKLLLDEKYILDIKDADSIQSVERIGGWDSKKYRVLDALERVDVISDSCLVGGEDAEAAVQEDLQKKLKATQEELSKLKVRELRDKLRRNILKEDARVAGAILEEYLNGLTATYEFTSKNLSTYKVWREKHGNN